MGSDQNTESIWTIIGIDLSEGIVFFQFDVFQFFYSFLSYLFSEFQSRVCMCLPGCYRVDEINFFGLLD